MSNSFNISVKPEIAAVKADTADIRTDVTAIHDTNLPAVKTDTADIRTDVTAIHDTDLPAVKDGIISNNTILADIHGTDLPSVKTDTSAIRNDVTDIKNINLPVKIMEFWGAPTQSIALMSAAADFNLNNVIISGIPSGSTFLRVEVMLNIGVILWSGANENYMSAAQKLRVKKSTGAWDTDDLDGIDFASNDFRIQTATNIGSINLNGHRDVKAEVDANGTYNLQLEDGKANADNLFLRTVQGGIRVFFQ